MMRKLLGLFAAVLAVQVSGNVLPEWSQWSKSRVNCTGEGKQVCITRSEAGFCELISPVIKVTEKLPQIASIKYKVCGTEVTGSAVLSGFDDGGKLVYWRSLENFSKTFDWRESEHRMLIPEPVAKLKLSFRLSNENGALWLEDAAMTFQDCSNMPPGVELLKQTYLGSKSGDMPKDWVVKYWHNLESTYEVKPGANGVDLRYISGGARFGIQPELLLNPVPAGTALKLTARYRCGKEAQAVLTAEFFNAQGQPIGEKSTAPGTSGNWSDISGVFVVPPDTAKMNFYLLNTGKGTVTYLNASLTTTQSGEAVAEFPVTVYASPSEGNRLVYGGEHIFHSIADSPNSLCFDFWGRTKETPELAFVLEVPVTLRVAECFSSHPTVYRSEVPEITEFTRDGTAYRRYTYQKAAAFKLIGPGRQWCRQLIAAFEPVGGNFPSDHKVYYYLSDRDRKSTPVELTVRILPPLPELPAPKRFHYYGWTDYDLNFPDRELLKRVIGKYEKAHLNSRLRNSNKELQEIDELLAGRGWRMHNPEQDYCQTRMLTGFRDKLPGLRLEVMRNGQNNPARICPRYFIEDQQFQKLLQEQYNNRYARLNAKSGDWILLDYEPWGTMNSCFCPVCLERFAQSHLGGKAATAAEIAEKHAAAWAEFRVAETVSINRIMVEMIGRINPNFVFIDYDYPVAFDQPGFEKMFQSVCKDPRSYEHLISAHFSSFYHHLKKKAFDLIDVNVKTLKKPVYMTPSLSRNDLITGSYTTTEETQSPRQFRQTVLSAAVSGCPGLSIFPGHQIDGQFFVEIQRAMSEIALFEDFLFDGKRNDAAWKFTTLPNEIIRTAAKEIAIPNWPDFFGHRAHELKGETLLSLLNFNGRYPLYLNLPDPGRVVIDPVKKLRLTPEGGRVWLKIDPEDVRFLKIVDASDYPQVSSLDVRAEYETLMKSTQASAAEPVKIGLAKAEMTDFDQDGFPEVTISAPEKTVIVSSKGGIIQKWREGKLEITSDQGDPSAAGLLWDYLLEPLHKYAAGDQPYRIRKISAAGDEFKLELESEIAVHSLKIEKLVTVPVGKKEIRAEYTLTNTGKVAKKFSFWSHNFPRLGAEKPLTEMTITLPEHPALALEPPEQLFTVGSQPPVRFTKITGNTTAQEVVCTAAGGKIKLSMDRLNQFYFWRGVNPTVEMMSEAAELAPGQNCKFSVRLTLE